LDESRQAVTRPSRKSESPATPAANYQVADRDLKYYIFDWDDNILHMPTRIHLERRTPDGKWVPHPVSTSVFAVIRSDTENYRPPGGDWERAFHEFRDLAADGESNFLRDTRLALEPVVREERSGAPSFQQFRRALIEGRLFAIVTARGHKAHSLREGVRYFIEHVLKAHERSRMLRNLRGYLECFEPGHGLETDDEVIDNYLDLNCYHPVTSPAFRERIGNAASGDNTEEGKQFAIKDFVEHVVAITRRVGATKPISVGFSDDDPANLAAVENYIRRKLASAFPGIKFVVYDTSDPDVPSGRKVVVSGQLDLGLATKGTA
jgi:hypothetical protein